MEIKSKAWVWFKGGIDGGEWIPGFTVSETAEDKFLIESNTYKKCTIPGWRIIYNEPENKHEGPIIPEGSIWKYN
tara:strand:- start:6027 stop:6251 length:225 start_codon:yes stop_codon:yes gene_type:complete